jgi:hypothetical protein
MKRRDTRLSVLALAVVSELALLSAGAVARASCPQVGFTLVEPRLSSETRAVRVGGSQTIYVRRVPLTTTSDIVEIKLADDGGGDASLLIKFAPAAAQRLHDATTNHSGLRIAFMADDDVLLNVVWEGPYGVDTDGTQVSLEHGMKRARRLMEAIRGCTGASG